MRLHRFIGSFDLNQTNLKINNEELINQVKNVLRLKDGDEIILCDGNLNEAKARIVEIKGNEKIDLEILEKYKNANEPDIDVTLYCAILKRENFELVVQKGVEVGIKEIIPIISERTIKLDIRKDRLEKIIKEASEQSGRGILPTIQKPVDFKEAVNQAKDFNILLDSSGEMLKDIKPENNKKINVWIGPEGGWSPDEIDLAKNSSFKIISLGKLTLRAETAAILASYIIVHNSDF